VRSKNTDVEGIWKNSVFLFETSKSQKACLGSVLQLALQKEWGCEGIF
jgi:hypothetical protein